MIIGISKMMLTYLKTILHCGVSGVSNPKSLSFTQLTKINQLPYLASLPMYDWPEAKADNDRLWQSIRGILLNEIDGLPNELEQTAGQLLEAHWQNSNLLFSQSCWGPLKAGGLDYLEPLAQPCYSKYQGGNGPMYRSAIIARDGRTVDVPTHQGSSSFDGLLENRKFGYNHPTSLSGIVSLSDDLQTDLKHLQDYGVITGSHRHSIKMVAEGIIDVAAIDCRSWAIAKDYEPSCESCRVIGWTSERIGLPYVTNRHTEPKVKMALRDALISIDCYCLG